MSELLMGELALEPAGVPRGRAMVDRADWAARAFASYDVATVRRIVEAVAQAGAQWARELAEDAVAETGFGVVEHKLRKNLGCSIGLWETYRDHDYVTPQVDEAARILSVPRPAGVVLALTPSTNPVATTFFKVILSLLTRNAVIVSPHPLAKQVGARAAAILAEAAVAAGAPDGCVQVVAEPSVPLINALMTNERVSVIVATGGTPMVRAAYSSANPALGVGPGNVPVLVDDSADLPTAARLITESKSFDNSVLCTNESVLIVTAGSADRLAQCLRREGAHIASPSEVAAIRSVIFDGGTLRTEWIGKDATAIAKAAGVRVAPRTTVLVTPIDLVVHEEMLAHEKLCPVLAMVTVPSAARGIAVAQAVLRIAGQGHSAGVHSNDPATVLSFAAAVRVLRVCANVGTSLGGSGFETNLAPSMTIGTGFFGRSSLGTNLAPEHLVHHTRVAYSSAASGSPMPSFAGLEPWRAPTGEVPTYPIASNLPTATPSSNPVVAPTTTPVEEQEFRDQIRRLVIEELKALVKG